MNGTYTQDTVDQLISDTITPPIKKDLSNLTVKFRSSFFDRRMAEFAVIDQQKVALETPQIEGKIVELERKMMK